jgi:hypothetical protein
MLSLRRSLKNRARKHNSKRTIKRGGGRKSMTRSGKVYRGNPTFAAKLAAFILESVKDTIYFNKKSGFSNKHHQVFGVLPYLHMNISETEFRKQLKDSQTNRNRSLTKLCNKNKLNKKLSSVGFNCKNQSTSGVHSVNESIVDSINNRWNMRKNGQKRLKTIMKTMQWQVKNNKIPSSSLKWCENL